MRFVQIKSEEQHGLDAASRRELFIRQRTMLINAIRGHMAELGIIGCKGPQWYGSC